VPKVFISYRQIDDAQRLRVREFAARVKAQGIEVILDQFYKEENPGASDDGWTIWSENQAEETERVLVIASPEWFACYMKKSPPGHGLGAAAEAHIIHRRITKAGTRAEGIRIVALDEDDRKSIPLRLEDFPYFTIYQTGVFDEMIAWLGATPVAVVSPAAPTTPAIPWPSIVSFPPGALADRRDQCALFRDMLSGVAADSVACVIAGSGTGKSKLLKVLQEVAMDALGRTGRVAYVKNLQEQKGVCELLHYLCGALGSYPEFPRYEKTLTEEKTPTAQRLAFLHDLKARTKPALIILDTWEKGTEELRQWITGHLVPASIHGPGVKLVLGGQPAADYPAADPDVITRSTLEVITQDDWHQFIDLRYAGDASTLKPMIDLCLAKAHGVKAIANILDILEKGEAAA
jgi:hypothetical protein